MCVHFGLMPFPNNIMRLCDNMIAKIKHTKKQTLEVIAESQFTQFALA